MRIRNTKPEFWRSKRVAEGIPDWGHRHILKALESYVDDNGVGKDDLALIVSDCFSQDVALEPSRAFKKVHEGVDALNQAGFIHRYEADGEKLIYISWWESTQYVNRPKNGRHPRPDGTWNYGDSEIGPPNLKLQEASSNYSAESGNQGIRESGNKESSRARPKRPLPDDWEPTESHRAKARELSLNLEAETEKFTTFHQSKDNRYADWSKAFHTWLTRAAEYEVKRPQPHISAADRAMQRGHQRHQQIENGQLGQTVSWDDIFTQQQQIERGTA